MLQEIGQTVRGLNERVVGATTYPLLPFFASLAPLGVTTPDPRVGPYTLVNLRAGYSFWNDKVVAAVSVFNALNDRYKEHPLGDTIGSRVLGSVTLRY